MQGLWQIVKNTPSLSTLHNQTTRRSLYHFDQFLGLFAKQGIPVVPKILVGATNICKSSACFFHQHKCLTKDSDGQMLRCTFDKYHSVCFSKLASCCICDNTSVLGILDLFANTALTCWLVDKLKQQLLDFPFHRFNKYIRRESV